MHHPEIKAGEEILLRAVASRQSGTFDDTVYSSQAEGYVELVPEKEILPVLQEQLDATVSRWRTLSPFMFGTMMLPCRIAS